MEPTTGYYRMVLSVIPAGRENAKPMRQVALETRTNTRIVRKVIERARIAGKLIASCDDGYFIPETMEDLLTFYRKRRRAAMTTLATLETARQLLQDYGIDFPESDKRRAGDIDHECEN